jgi:hypothetical protein
VVHPWFPQDWTVRSLEKFMVSPKHFIRCWLSWNFKMKIVKKICVQVGGIVRELFFSDFCWTPPQYHTISSHTKQHISVIQMNTYFTQSVIFILFTHVGYRNNFVHKACIYSSVLHALIEAYIRGIQHVFQVKQYVFYGSIIIILNMKHCQFLFKLAGNVNMQCWKLGYTTLEYNVIPGIYMIDAHQIDSKQTIHKNNNKF